MVGRVPVVRKSTSFAHKTPSPVRNQRWTNGSRLQLSMTTRHDLALTIQTMGELLGVKPETWPWALGYCAADLYKGSMEFESDDSSVSTEKLWSDDSSLSSLQPTVPDDLSVSGESLWSVNKMAAECIRQHLHNVQYRCTSPPKEECGQQKMRTIWKNKNNALVQRTRKVGKVLMVKEEVYSDAESF